MITGIESAVHVESSHAFIPLDYFCDANLLELKKLTYHRPWFVDGIIDQSITAVDRFQDS